MLLDKLEELNNQSLQVGVVMSTNGVFNWKYELGKEDNQNYSFDFYENSDFMAPFASGSANYSDMIICPCSMGLMGRIAAGISTDLISRAADVMLKERKRLILVPRDAPYSLIHIKNMKVITEAGGIICPASPSFYSKPNNFEELAATVVDRIIDLIGLNQLTYRWGEEEDRH